MYRVVQLNFTPEIELFYMLFQRSLSIFSMTYLKQHIQCSCSGWPTGNGKKLSNSKPCCLAQLCLAAA